MVPNFVYNIAYSTPEIALRMVKLIQYWVHRISNSSNHPHYGSNVIFDKKI